jgi:hypothetical protein
VPEIAQNIEGKHITPKLLRAAGVALYGERWHPALADALGINVRSIQRMAAGKREIPERFRAELAGLCKAQHQELARLIEQLEA